MSDEQHVPPRPSEIALLLLASGDLLPRQRARDQQSDLSGNELKRQLLNSLVLHDPEPDQLEAALEEIIAELGPPTGPTRGVAMAVMEDWRAACESPAFVEWLLEQAVHEGQARGERRRRGQNVRSNI
ncbi:MAG: hypothetical protein MI924_23120 [Chloroflexales bacterium]|nr:hypothetical protein [Chloroflexales bacterium]